MKLLVHRYGAIGDTLALSAFLAPMRGRFEDIILSGQQERLRLLDPVLYDEAISHDLARDRVLRLAREADLSVAFSAGPMEDFKIVVPPFTEERINIYEYMRRAAVELGGDPGVALGIPVHQGAGLVVHPGSGSAAKNAPLEFFIEAARRAEGATFVLGPAEVLTLERSIVAAGFRCSKLSSLAELKTVILAHAEFLGNDSGPAHIAALGGLRTRIVYVGSDPELWKPPGDVEAIRLSAAHPEPDLLDTAVDES